MRFKPGDRVRLKNDPACVGVVMEVRAEAGMVRYLVFHSAHEIREYNEEQLERVGDVERWRICGFEEFLARFAAASLLDPVTDFFYTWGTGGRIDFVPHQFKPVLRFLRLHIWTTRYEFRASQNKQENERCNFRSPYKTW